MHRDDLSKEFNLQTFKKLVTGLVDTELYDESKDIHHASSVIKNAENVGHFLDNRFNNVLIITHDATVSARVKLATDTFKLMAENNIDKALVAYVSTTDEQEWRFSYISISIDEIKGKIKKSFSNPRRYSYVLGPRAKTATPYNYLISKDRVNTLEELQKRFSLEVVNKEFYSSIALLYTELVGGTRKKGSKIINFPGLLKIHGKSSQSLEHQEFAVRLIGRLVFCWFLREKKSSKGTSLIPEEILSANAAKKSMYYHSTLEPLFFELLNKKQNKREDAFRDKTPYNLIPYLNGGLFSPQKGEGGDYYEYSEVTSGGRLGIVDVPDTWLQRFTEILDTYNFTVDENTSHDVELSVDPEMLGRIFENLLAEINPETGESARKSTGSFYTPREVVEYMVDRSLVYYLINKTGIDKDKIEALITFGIEDDLDYPRNDEEDRKIVDALAELKVLDPAAGSGAFPIGVLQKVVYLLQQVDPNSKHWLEKQLKNVSPELRRHLESQYENQNYDYLRKLGVIRESIFGVDIQPIATEISRLRCFLTLIVEEKVEDEAPNRGIEPLPNLDFKFVTANSLKAIPRDKRTGGKERQESESMQLFEDINDVEELSKIRSNYFGASPDERHVLQAEFSKLQRDMTIKSMDNFSTATSKMYAALSRWEPFEHGETDWFDPEWMFGIDKFDIVIANPPYIGERGHSKMFHEIKNDGLGEFYYGKMDIYYFFFHQALNLTSNEGFVTFITTNSYFKALGAKKLRKDIKERAKILELVDFNGIKIFDSADNFTAISILQRDGGGLTTKITVAKHNGYVNNEVLNSILYRNDDQSMYRDEEIKALYSGEDLHINILQNDNEQSISDKLRKSEFKLGEIFNVNAGIQTGADKVLEPHISKYEISEKKGTGIFVLTSGELSHLFGNSEIPSYFMPWHINSDIRKWLPEIVTNHYVAYISRSFTETEAGSEYIAYLRKFRPILEQRREVKNGVIDWWKLQWPREKGIFDEPKVICCKWSDKNDFSYTDKPWYSSVNITYINNKKFSDVKYLKYVCALLNSSLYYFWYFKNGKRAGNRLMFDPRPIMDTPVIIPNDIVLNEVVEMFEQAAESNNSGHQENLKVIEKKLNNKIFDIYNISPEEINIVDGLLE